MSSSPMSDQLRPHRSASQETAIRRPEAPVLGTPWTSSATKVALLGAGEIGKEVAIALTRLGVEVTAIDRYEGAPAQQVAHNAMTVDMSDPEALTAAIRASGAAVVIPEIEALATDALAALDKPIYAICEQDCYPCDPSFPKQNAINMRTYLAECGLGLA